MHLSHLNILNFKNIEQAELLLSEGINCFVGNNGVGKTNLLDSVYYLSFCKSYFNSIDSQLINHNKDFFVIQGKYIINNLPEDVFAGLKKNQKKQFKINKKEYPRLSDHIGLIPLVMISPGDERLITEGSDQRRKYVDGVISQFNKSYLNNIIRYSRVLTQRNTLLKNANGNYASINKQIDVWNEQLIFTGSAIFDQRVKFIAQLEPVFQKYYSFISGGREEVGMAYHSHYQNGDMRELLGSSINRDLALGYTTKGIHRDDLELTLNGYPVKKDGSQGQRKTFFIAMKLAQFEFLSGCFGFPPILLLDDLFDKLDEIRAGKLIELVAKDEFKQIFITDTQKDRLLNIVKKTGKNYFFFNVNDGSVILQE